MRRFQKRPELAFAVIPGIGRITAGQILEGDHLAKFVPSLLVEIPAAPAAPALVEPKPAPKPAPKASSPKPPAVLVPPPPPPAPTPVPQPSAPPRAAPPATMADAGFVSPEELVKAVDDENKQTQVQIDQAVARLDPVPEEPKKKEAPKPKPSSGKKPSGRK